MRENIEVGSYKLNVSRHDQVATDANHDNVSFYSLSDSKGLAFRRRFRFVILALLAFCLRGLREDVLFLLRASPPRNF